MADIYFSSTTGKTVTVQLFTDTGAHGNPIAMVEIQSTGEYRCDLPVGVPAGKYLVVFFEGSEKLGSGVIEWDGQNEVASTNGVTPFDIKSALEAPGSKLDRAMKAAQAAEDQTA